MSRATRRTLLAALGAAGISTLTGDDEMATSKFGPAAYSDGDIGRRLRRIESEINQIRTARNLQAASIGAGGLRIHSGGGIVVEGADGEGDVFRVNSDPVELFLRPELLDQLTRQITGASINFDNAEGQVEIEDQQDFVPAPDGLGPEVDVQISDVGRALVMIGCTLTGTSTNHHSMSFEVSGATSQAATGFRSVQQQHSEPVVSSSSISVLVDGLNEGPNTFSARYSNQSTGTSAFFSNRWMIVYPY